PTKRDAPHESLERLPHELPGPLVLVDADQPCGVGIPHPTERARSLTRLGARGETRLSERDAHARGNSPGLLAFDTQRLHRLGQDTAKSQIVEQASGPIHG